MCDHQRSFSSKTAILQIPSNVVTANPSNPQNLYVNLNKLKYLVKLYFKEIVKFFHRTLENSYDFRAMIHHTKIKHPFT
jgi:hypothetical protein